MKRETAHLARKAWERLPSSHRPAFEPLESRWLFSADLLPMAAPDVADAHPAELVLVDASVADLAPLLAERASAEGRDVEVVVLNAHSDGVRQVTDLLAQRRNVTALHVVSHGRAGTFQLGSTLVDTGVLQAREGEFTLWAGALAEDADLLLYGCDVGAGLAGDLLTSTLARVTGADVAASDDATGSTALGGDWELERSLGAVTASVLSLADANGSSLGILALDAYDSFVVAGQLDGSTGGAGWADAWSVTAPNRLQSTGAGLSEPNDLLASAGGSVRNQLTTALLNVTATRNLADALGADGTTAWFSFLVRPDETDSPFAFAGLLFGNGTGPSGFFAGQVGGSFTVEQTGGIGRATVSGATPQSGVTAFLVLRIDFAAGNDTMTLYVNPTPGLQSPDSAFTAVKNDADLGTFTRVGILTGRGLSMNNAEFDELRIGSSYAEVAPSLLVTTTADTNASGITEGDPTHTIAWLNARKGAAVSLREALIAAENTPGVNGIQFAIADALVNGRHTITLTSPLPILDEGVVIDGTTEADYAGAPVIVLEGSALGGSGVGLALNAGASLVTGLAFRDFGQAAITVGPAATVAVADSLFENAGAVPIDLGADQAVQANDPGDADGGANDGLNFPVLYGAVISGGNVTLTGEARPGVTVQFFEADNGPAGHGGAIALIGTGTVGGTGTAGAVDPTAIQFSFTFAQGSLSIGDAVSALATEAGTRTSEFSANLAATEANVAPVLDPSRSPALAAIPEDAGAPSGAVGTLISDLVDFASPVGQLDNVTDANTAPLLGIAVIGADNSQGSLWYTTDGGVHWDALGSPTIAAARLLAADTDTRLYFQPAAHFHGTIGSAITFRAWDRTSGTAGGTADTTVNGGATAFSVATDTVSVTVTPVNDAPTISAIPDQSVAEDTASGLIAFTVDDVDDAVGALSVSAWSSDPGLIADADLVLGGSGTHRTLSFTPVADANGGPATIHVRVSDGAAFTDLTFQVTITPVNDAPVNTAPASVTARQNETFTFGGTDRLFVSDVDAGSAELEVTLTADHGGAVTLADTAGLTFTIGDGTDDASVRFRGTLSAINTALDGLLYRPGSGHTGAATLTFATSDLGATGTGGALTDTDVVAITVIPNVSTSVHLSPGGIVFTEGDAPQILDGALTLTDGDDTVLHGASVRIASNFSAGEDALVFADQSGITGVWDGTAGVLILSGSAALADYQTALRSVRYANTSNAPATATRTVTFAAADGNGLGAAASLTLDVTAVNDAPLILGPSTAAATEDTAFTFSTGAGTALTIADPDAGTGSLRVTLTASTGTLTLASTAGLTFASGANGMASMAFEGTLAHLNDALDGLSFLADANFHGAATLQIAVDDGGHFGAGGALTDSATIAVTVAPVNDLPTLPVNTGLSLAEGGTATFSAIELAASDVESGPAQLTFRVSLPPDHGSLMRSGIVLGAGATFTQADVAAGLVAYTHDGGESTTDRVVLDVTDGDGGTLVGQQVALSIAPVNDPLVITAARIDVPANGTATLTAAMVAATDPDGAQGPIRFEVRSVRGGSFQRGADPAPVTAFTEAEIASGTIRFVLAPGATDGAFEIRATDGTVSTDFIAGTIVVTTMDSLLLAMGQPPAPATPTATAPVPNGSDGQDRGEESGTQTGSEAEITESSEDRTVMQMPVPSTPSPAGRPPAGAPDGSRPPPGPATPQGDRSGASASATRETPEATPSSASAGVTQAPATSRGLAGVPPVTAPDLSALRIDTQALARHEKTLRDTRFVEALDAVSEAQGEKQRVEALVVGSTTAVASSVSVGYLLWLMRGGALAASLLASLPAWRSLDPTPILSRGDDDEGPGGDGPDDPLESLFNRARDALGRRRGAAPAAASADAEA